jgi:hypothetical protein
MCCNADILFCVLVLHWVTSKEQKEEDSLARSTGAAGSKANHTATIGSHMSRSRRVSITVVEEELEKANSNGVKRPDSAMNNRLNVPATITTECISAKKDSPSGFTRYRRGNEWEVNEPGKGQREDEVELRNIHVHTIQTREVEVGREAERDGSHSAAASADEDGDAWSRRGVVVVERMI